MLNHLAHRRFEYLRIGFSKLWFQRMDLIGSAVNISSQDTGEPLLAPFRLKHLTLRNRILSTAHAPAFAEDGHPKERYRRYHEEKARGGCALTVIGGSTNVSPDSPSVFGQLYAGDDSIIPWFIELTTGVKSHGAAVMCQLTHMGRRTGWDDGDWLPVVGPSGKREHAHRSMPKIADTSDLKRITRDFANAASRCQQAGFDGIEILSHAHLLGQFLSPDINTRTDHYGGSLENRLRLTLEVLDAVRKRTGDAFIVGIRMTANEETENGLTLQDGIRAAQLLDQSGTVDFLNVLTGAPYDDLGLAGWVPPMGLLRTNSFQNTKSIRQSVTVPVFHAGGINDLATARHLITEGVVDMVGMTRAQIADPYLVTKLKDGIENQIRPCVGLGYCVDRVNQGKPAVCGHNPATGREALLPQVPVRSQIRKRVVIVGGGVGGMEAARVAATQGHSVTLFEAAPRLGGQLNLAVKSQVRNQIGGISTWLIDELARLKVDIRVNTFADQSDIVALSPDLVVIATGGMPNDLAFTGNELAISSWDVLSGNAYPEGTILLWDETGTHAAGVISEHLASSAVDLHFATPDTEPLTALGATTKPVTLRSLYNSGVNFLPNVEISKMAVAGNRQTVTLKNILTQSEQLITVDAVVIENGTTPNTEVFERLASLSKNQGTIDRYAMSRGQPCFETVYDDGDFLLACIGDAVASRNIHAAMLEGARLLHSWSIFHSSHTLR